MTVQIQILNIIFKIFIDKPNPFFVIVINYLCPFAFKDISILHFRELVLNGKFLGDLLKDLSAGESFL